MYSAGIALLAPKRSYVNQPLALRANPAGRIYQSSSQLVNASTETAIKNTTTDYLFGGFTTASNGLVVPVAGVYRVSASVRWGIPLGSMGRSLIAVRVNGTDARLQEIDNQGTGILSAHGPTDDILLDADDALTWTAWHNASGGANTSSGSSQTFLSASLISS